jgi:phenylacetate-CoA ligase
MIRTAIGPLWARWENSPYLGHYQRLKREQFDPLPVLQERQWATVRAMVSHAYATVPYYREHFDRRSLHPDHLRTWNDFLRVPVLTKADIRVAGKGLLSNAYDPKMLHCKKTSGSTGVPLEIWIDEPALQRKRACTLRSDEWSGWRWGEARAVLWGDPECRHHGWRGRLRNALLERQLHLDTLRVNPAQLADFADRLRRRRPTLIYGHAHSVYLLAQFIRSTGHRDIRPRGIITTAMVLLDGQRRHIEETFGCPVTNRYGCEEVSIIACECDQHAGLHVIGDNVYLELVREGRPVAAGEPGAVVVTDLANRAMPLLRYQVGDVAVFADRPCRCGRGWPLLERLEGRVADYVVTPAGQMISGISLTDHFGAQIPGVAQLQIIQETVNSFRFRLVRDAAFGPASLARMQQLVQERFGPGVSYQCEYVDQILPEVSGKYRFCISRVANPFMSAHESMRS